MDFSNLATHPHVDMVWMGYRTKARCAHLATKATKVLEIMSLKQGYVDVRWQAGF